MSDGITEARRAMDMRSNNNNIKELFKRIEERKENYILENKKDKEELIEELKLLEQMINNKWYGYDPQNTIRMLKDYQMRFDSLFEQEQQKKGGGRK